jgi:hypothetical protein
MEDDIAVGDVELKEEDAADDDVSSAMSRAACFWS